MKIKEILKGVIYWSDYLMPLRKELLFWCLIILWLSSFCSAWTITNFCNVKPWTYWNWNTLCVVPVPNNWVWIVEWSCYMSWYVWDTPATCNDCTLRPSQCYSSNWNSSSLSCIYPYEVPNSQLVNWYVFWNTFSLNGELVMLSMNFRYFWTDFTIWDNVQVYCTFTWDTILNAGSKLTSEECQTEYNLIPSENLTTCNNNLLNCQNSLSWYDTLLNNCSTNLNSCNSSLSSCLQLNCPVSSGGVSWSSLFINDIQHIGAPTINISIPNEIQWDYLNENDEFNLTVDWYNVDSDYIEWVINIQNSKPTKEDFNNIITWLIPLFVPWLVIILFIYLIISCICFFTA